MDPLTENRLPRLPREEADWRDLQRWWQLVVEAIEAATAGVNGSVQQGVGPAWVAPTGTAARATFATYTAPAISAAPTQAEVQALADHVQILSRTVKALVDDLKGNGSLT